MDSSFIHEAYVNGFMFVKDKLSNKINDLKKKGSLIKCKECKNHHREITHDDQIYNNAINDVLKLIKEIRT